MSDAGILDRRGRALVAVETRGYQKNDLADALSQIGVLKRENRNLKAELGAARLEILSHRRRATGRVSA